MLRKMYVIAGGKKMFVYMCGSKHFSLDDSVFLLLLFKFHLFAVTEISSNHPPIGSELKASKCH